MQNTWKENTELFYHTCHIPLAVYDDHLKMVCSHGLVETPLEWIGKLNLEDEVQAMKTSYKNIETALQEHYMLMNKDGHYLLAGPFLHKSKDFSVEKLMQKNQIPAIYTKAFYRYFASLPDIAAMDIPYYYRLLERLFEISDGCFSNPEADLLPFTPIDKTLLEYMEIEFTHHNYYYEQQRIKAMLPDTELITSWQNLDQRLSVAGTIANNDERNLKNLIISTIAIMGRSAIEKGIDAHISFTMMDSYLRRIEDCHNISDLAIFLADYTRKLQNVMKLSRNASYSRLVRDVITYIDSHLSAAITLEDAARHVHLSPGYLSMLFKKETGITFSACLTRKRVEEAQKMLDYTDFNLQNISDTLCFSSKSYFCKCFKRQTGMTPTQYRERKK